MSEEHEVKKSRIEQGSVSQFSLLGQTRGESFDALVSLRHPGTFSGVMENISHSVLRFLLESVRSHYPEISDDIYRDDQRRRIHNSPRDYADLLMGMKKRLVVATDDGNLGLSFLKIDRPSINEDDHQFLIDLINVRNVSAHEVYIYDRFSKFSRVCIPIGNHHVFIFNPGSTERKFIAGARRPDYFLSYCAREEADVPDMESCTYKTSHVRICLFTKKQFEKEHPDTKPSVPHPTYKWFLVVEYAREAIPFSINFRTYTMMVKHLGNSSTKSYFFQFIASRLLKLLFPSQF